MLKGERGVASCNGSRTGKAIKKMLETQNARLHHTLLIAVDLETITF